MKRIICLLLAMMLCLTVLVGCVDDHEHNFVDGECECGEKDPEAGEDPGDEVVDENLDNALIYLSQMYKELSGTYVNDFDVVAYVSIADCRYPITWTASDDSIKIRESVELGNYTVDIPDDNSEEISFTLTATIASEITDETRVKTFNIKIPAVSAEGTLTILEALELGGAQPDSQYTSVKYYVSGTVTKITQETYGNLYIADENGSEILVYGTYDATGTVRYDKMATKPAVGDTVTFYSVVGNYKGDPQLKNAWLVALNGEELGGENGDQGGTTGGILLDMMGSTNVESYSKTQLIYSANGIILTNDKNTSTTDCYNNTSTYAARFYAGSTLKIEYKGMTKIMFVLDDYSPDGTKTYLAGFDNMTVEGATIVRNHDIVTIYFTAPTDVFQSAALGSQIRVEQIEVFTGAVETPPTGGEDNGNQGGTETPDVLYDAPVADQAYNLYLVQSTLGKTLYFAGTMDEEKGTYLATTDNVAAAVDIYFEPVTGGYHIYFMDGNNKVYINAEAYLKSNGYAGCHFQLVSAPSCVWTFNTELGILEVYGEVEGKSDTFFAGTYGTYNTISLSGAYYKDQIPSGTQFPARISISGSEGGNTPDTPDTPEQPDTPTEPDEPTEPDTPVEPDEPADAGYVKVTELKTGDKVVIGAPAHGMALSTQKTGYYNVGIQYSANDFSNITNAEIFTVTKNNDGSYTFVSLTGDVIALAADYSSLNVEGTNDSWTLEAKEGADGIFYLKNVGRGNYLEWYAEKNNWSTYAPSALSDLFELSFYAVVEGGNTDTPTEPETPSEPETPVEPETPEEGGNDNVQPSSSAEISFADAANRTDFTTSIQVWEQNGIKVTNDKGSSSSNVADYSDPARFYKNSSLTVEYANMVKIVFNCDSASYATALQSSIPAADGVTVTVDGSAVTVELAQSASSFNIAALSGGQVRVDSITVYTA